MEKIKNSMGTASRQFSYVGKAASIVDQGPEFSV